MTELEVRLTPEVNEMDTIVVQDVKIEAPPFYGHRPAAAAGHDWGVMNIRLQARPSWIPSVSGEKIAKNRCRGL